MYVCSQSRRTRRDRTRQASYGYVLTHTGLVKKQGGYAFGCACLCVCVLYIHTHTHGLPSVSQAHDDLGEKKKKGSAREDEKKKQSNPINQAGLPSPLSPPGRGPILSYPILSCPILSYPVLSYPVLTGNVGEARPAQARFRGLILWWKDERGIPQRLVQ